MNGRPTSFRYVLLFIVLTACGSSTRIVQSWRDPAVTVQQGSVKKMLVIALIKDESTRRIAEDQLCLQFRGRGIASYGYLGVLPAQIEVQPLLERLRTDSIEAIMVMRLTEVTTEQTYVPGSYPSYYGNPWGYYGYSYPMYADPGYVRTDQTYKVESNFYSVTREKLVWSGISSSLNPMDISSTVDEIAVAIREKMVFEGFLTAPAP